jgi:hypothetical protein
MDSIEKPKLKKNSKKSDKKGFHKDIQYEIDYYEYQKNLDNKSILEYRNTE